MAKASKKHFGGGAQGKHAETGANTDIQKEIIGENMVLSNRRQVAALRRARAGRQGNPDRTMARPCGQPLRRR